MFTPCHIDDFVCDFLFTMHSQMTRCPFFVTQLFTQEKSIYHETLFVLTNFDLSSCLMYSASSMEEKGIIAGLFSPNACHPAHSNSFKNYPCIRCLHFLGVSSLLWYGFLLPLCMWCSLIFIVWFLFIFSFFLICGALSIVYVLFRVW